MLGVSRMSLLVAHHNLSKSVEVVRNFSGTCALLRNTGLSRGKPLRIWQWREKRDIPRCGTEYGPLTDLPDWSYEDGRPGVLTRGQRFRLDENEEYAQRISFLLNETDSAVLTHEANQEEVAAERERIIKNKLREKGTPFPGNSRVDVKVAPGEKETGRS